MIQIVVWAPDSPVLMVVLGVLAVVAIFQVVKWIISFIPYIGT